MRYPARFTYQRDVGGYAVRFRDVPEALTCGDTKRESLRHAVDALETALAYYVKDGRPIPEPSQPQKGEVLVPLTLGVTAQIFLYNELFSQSIDPAELARLVKLPPRRIKGLLNLLKEADVDAIAIALRVFGKRLEVYVT